MFEITLWFLVRKSYYNEIKGSNKTISTPNYPPHLFWSAALSENLGERSGSKTLASEDVPSLLPPFSKDKDRIV